jgi:glycosyltransferase involved in cell wall biosynthesis
MHAIGSGGNPLVTIAIPTYNRAGGYLPIALKSALAQTYQPVEIIVSDNCSTDDTEAVVRGFGDDRVRYFRQATNIGASNNFQLCLERAQGVFFQLLHDDDLIDPDFVEACMRAAPGDGNIGLIRTGTRIIDASGRILREHRNVLPRLTPGEFFRAWFADETELYLSSSLFRTDRLREIGGFRSRHNLFSDVVAEVQLAARFGWVDVPDVKASFRVHPAEMTFAADAAHWCEDSLLLLDLLVELSGPDGDLTRAKGMPFFAKFNYNRARGVVSVPARLRAYATVYRMFGFRHLPPRGHLGPLLISIVAGTPLYRGLRALKRRVAGGPRGA